MNTILRVGVVVVQLAFVFYTIGVAKQQRGRRATTAVLGLLGLGVTFDATATACMMLGSERSLFTPHGLLGYSALAAMVTDTVLMRRHRRSHGDAEVPRGLHLYSRYAYSWWVVAYVTGAAMVMLERRG